MVFAVCNDRAGGFGSEDAAFGVEADQSAGEKRSDQTSPVARSR